MFRRFARKTLRYLTDFEQIKGVLPHAGLPVCFHHKGHEEPQRTPCRREAPNLPRLRNARKRATDKPVANYDTLFLDSSRTLVRRALDARS